MFVKFWPYFDSESILAYPIPSPPERPNRTVPPLQNTSVSTGTRSQSSQRTLQEETISQVEFDRQTDVYYKEHAVYRKAAREYDRYLDAEIKLRNKITITVFSEKEALLPSDLFVRQWLRLLINFTESNPVLMKESVDVEYQKFMASGFREWPAGGPQQWLAKWENLLVKFERYGIDIINWMAHVFAVWQDVFDLISYFKSLERDRSWGTLSEVHFIRISRDIQREYDQRKQRQTLRHSKTKAIRSAFSAVVPSYFGIEAPEFAENESEEAEDLAVASAGPETPQEPRSRPRNKRANTTKQGEDARKRFKSRPNLFCKGCGGNHMMKNCFLVLGKDKSWITEESRKIFEDNMKNPAFHKHVESVRHYEQ